MGSKQDSVPRHFCRACGLQLPSGRGLTLTGLPASAQGFLAVEDIGDDETVTLNIVECEGCGVVQTRNPPVEYFREVIRASGYSPEMRVHREHQFRRFVEDHQLEAGKILEIGCGRGENLEILASLGIECFGIEYGEDSISRLDEIGLSAAKMFFDTGNEQVPDAPYDGFVFLNFLEHIPRPREMFSGIHNNLKDGAVGLVEVPNFDMILENSMFTEFVSDHIFYFSRDSLETILRCNGFDVLECEETWHRYTLTAVVKRRKRVEFSKMMDLTDQLTDEVRQFCDDHHEYGIAIWGAGHQALTVMAMSQIQDSVKYVIDSAPFKQNRYTPGTHLAIVSPEVFFSDEVGSVLVIAGSYSEEVRETIRARCQKSVRIGVLDGVSVKLVNDIASPVKLKDELS